MRVQRAAVCTLRAMADGVPEGQKAFDAAERSMDEWFALLADSRSSLRQMASVKIAEMHDADGKGDEVIHTSHGFAMYRISALTVGATPVAVPEDNRCADIGGAGNRRVASRCC